MKRVLFVLLLLAAAAFMTACGGEEAAESEPFAITVSGDDAFVYDPGTITVAAGTEVKIYFPNNCALDYAR